MPIRSCFTTVREVSSSSPGNFNRRSQEVTVSVTAIDVSRKMPQELPALEELTRYETERIRRAGQSLQSCIKYSQRILVIGIVEMEGPPSTASGDS